LSARALNPSAHRFGERHVVPVDLRKLAQFAAVAEARSFRKAAEALHMAHGQELAPPRMEALIRRAGREPVQRTTLYGKVPAERVERSRVAAPLAPVVQTPLRPRARVRGTHSAGALTG
jgi:hypothetical protein